MRKPIYMHSDEYDRSVKAGEISGRSPDGQPLIGERPVFVDDRLPKAGRFDIGPQQKTLLGGT